MEHEQTLIKAIREAEARGAPPLEIAAAHTELAELLHHQGRFADASSRFRLAYDTRCSLLGIDHPDTIASAVRLALTLAQGTQIGAALTLLRPLERELREMGSSQVGPVRYWVLKIASITAELPTALSEYKELLPELRASQSHPEELAFCLSDTAALVSHLDGPVAALPYYEEALEVAQSRLPDGHPMVTLLLQTLTPLRLMAKIGVR